MFCFRMAAVSIVALFSLSKVVAGSEDLSGPLQRKMYRGCCCKECLFIVEPSPC